MKKSGILLRMTVRGFHCPWFSLSQEAKDNELNNLNALACAAVKCASGVSENDSNYTELKALQDEGEQLEAVGLDIASTLEELGVDTKIHAEVNIRGVTYEGEAEQFKYSEDHAVQDFSSSELNEFSERVNNGAEALVNGVLTTIAPVVDAVDNLEEGLGFSEYMAERTRGNVEGTLNYESEVGQSVLDSFSSQTYVDAPNYALDAGLAGMEVLPAAKVLKNVGDTLANQIVKSSPQLDSTVADALKRTKEQPIKKLEYDVDNEVGFDTLKEQRDGVIESNQRYVDLLNDTTASTVDSKINDAELYENTTRSITQTKPAREQGPKGAAIEGSSKFLKGIRNVIEGMSDAE